VESIDIKNKNYSSSY